EVVGTIDNHVEINTSYGGSGAIIDWGVTGNALYRVTWTTEPVTFTFSEPVDVHSMLLIEYTGATDVDFTFSTTDGTNASHMVTTAAGYGLASESPVNLNWVGVTSFTLTPTNPGSPLFDHLTVSPSTALSVSEVNTFQTAKVYPNPVENILTIKNVSDLKSITVYNSLGQLVLQSKKKQLDVSHLSKGLYFLQIHSGQGIETKRIIKK
ncbi:MAG TPA: T9SS type A sorting domain-containing protein, partial [Flavobacteriaceae bacterium]